MPRRTKIRSIITPRKIKFVVLAGLVIALSLVSFGSVALFPGKIKALAGIILDYPSYIRLTNAIVAIICAAFLLWPREAGRVVGRWSGYVGVAFLTFSVQYSLRFLALQVDPLISSGKAEIIDLFIAIVVFFASYLNNGLLLAAARILLNKNKRGYESEPGSHDGFILCSKKKLTNLHAALPMWYLAAFPVSLIALLDGHFYPYCQWVRIPDAMLSVWCLSWFGYAVWLGLNVRGQRLLAAMSFVLVLAYGGGQLIYAINPYVAESIDNGNSQSLIARLVKARLGPTVTEVVYRPFDARDVKDASSIIDRITKPADSDFVSIYLHKNPASEPFKALTSEPRSPEMAALEVADELEDQLRDRYLYQKITVDPSMQRLETRVMRQKVTENGEPPYRLNRMLLEDAYNRELVKRMTPQTFFDGATFALLFPMKYLLFMPAFVLYLLSLVSVNDFREALRATTSRREDYLSKDGILSIIGRSLRADEVRLIIRVPGVERGGVFREERALSEVWTPSNSGSENEEPRKFPIKSDRLLVRAMQTEGKVIEITNEEVRSPDSNEEALPKTLTLVPIKFHGGVIGVLRVTFRGFGKYNDGTLEQLKFMAELIAPSVQDFRTVSAADKLGPRLIRMYAGKPRVSFNEAISKMVETQHDLLSPLAVGLLLECGFTDFYPIFPSNTAYSDILARQRVRFQPGEPIVVQMAEGPVRVDQDLLTVRTEEGRYNVGNLVVALPDDRDDFARPTLAAYYLTRQMVASLTANAISNAARNSLGVVIQDLGVALNAATLSHDEWFAEMEAAVRRAGLLWLAASEAEAKPWHGLPENIESINRLTDEERETLSARPIGCIPHRAAESNTRHIIQLQLPNGGRRLWIGVARERFGWELNCRSPWSLFLESLANVSDSALTRIEERQKAEARRLKEEEERLKAAQDEWIKTIADISATMMHQLVNMVTNLLETAEDLLEGAGQHPIELDNQVFTFAEYMKHYAEMMLDLTRAYNEITEMDAHRSCNLKLAAEHAQRLFQFATRKKQIVVELNVGPEVTARVPSNVVALALASLIGNAIEAIKSKGKIEIRTEVDRDGQVVLCHVINNGPPIGATQIPELFHPRKTIQNGHKGWGLYLISRSLENYGGSIVLLHSNRDATCFTLMLPT